MDRRVAEARLSQVLCGKYTLESVLGVGGMATVYRAVHRNGHRAAVKILHPHLAAYQGIRERFLKEAYTANRLEHAGAVCITDDDVAEDGAAFLVMELLDGETLDAWSERCGPALPPAEVARAMHEVLDVLIAAHKHGVIHRDLKPENIFRNRDGRIKVLDFGIARAIFDSAPSQTRTGSLLGTPAYMPPEQACGRIRDIDGRTDLWAVGATAFSLLAGRTVHTQDTVELLHVAAATQPAPPIESVAPGVPAPIAAVFDCALAFDKHARWANAREMQAALETAYLTAFGESLVTRDQAALQATLLPESRRSAAVPALETLPPSLSPARVRPAPSGAQPQQMTAPLTGSRPDLPPHAAPPVGASTTGALVSERGGYLVPPESPDLAPIAAGTPASPRRPQLLIGGVLATLVALGVAGGAMQALGKNAGAAPQAVTPGPQAARVAASGATTPTPTATETTTAPPSPPAPHTADAAPLTTGLVTKGTGPGPNPVKRAEPKPPDPKPVVSAEPAPVAPPPAAKPNCNPPYTLKDGIEVMKPECAHK